MANEELNKRVYVRKIKEFLDLTQIEGDEKSLDRWVIVPDINRPGLELSGYLESNDLKRVVVIGNKEYEYIKNFDEETQRQRFEIITDQYTPCIIISHNSGELTVLREICRRKNFPLFRYEGKTYQLIVDLVSFLSEELASSESIHGVMMNIHGNGVLITGKSGIGKSELALDLINRGHSLVADDRVDASRIHNDIVCKAPNILKKLLEIRGLGIVDVTRLFGATAYLNQCELNFIINLVRLEEAQEKDRLNPLSETKNILGVEVPMLTIPVTEGKALSVVVEAAVMTYVLAKRGINTNEEFKQKLYDGLAQGGNFDD